MNKLILNIGSSCLSILILNGNLYSLAQVNQPSKLGLTPQSTSTNAKSSKLNCTEEVNQGINAEVLGLIQKADDDANRGNIPQAANKIRQAIKLAQTFRGNQYKSYVLDSLVNVYGQPRLLDKIVSQAVKSGNKDQAANIIDETLKLTQTLNQSYSNIKTKSLSAIALYYTKINQPSKAIPILAEAVKASSFIQNDELKSFALTNIAKNYLAVGKSATALEMLPQSLKFAQKVANSYKQAEILQEIAIIYAKTGKDKQAIDLAKSIGNGEYKTKALSAIASQYTNNGKLAQALLLSQTVYNTDDKALVLAQIAAKYAQAKQLTQAATVFSKALNLAKALKNEELLANVAIIYGKAGQITAALKAVQSIENPVNKAKGLAAIAPLYATAGHQQQANQILAQSIASINTIPDTFQKTFTQQDITRSFTSSRQYDYASLVAQTIVDDFDRAKALRDIGIQGVQAKDYNKALQIVQTIDSKYIDERNIVLNKVAIALAQGGEYTRALQTAQKIQNFNSTYTYRAKTLAAIAKQYSKAKQPQKAATVFSQALQTANTLASPDAIAKAKAEIALEYALAGQANKASETLTQALKLVPNIKDSSLSLATLQEITNLYLEAGQYNLALQSIKAYNNPVYKNGISQELANKYLDAGQYDQAMQLVNTLTTPEDKTRLLVAIAGKYIQNQQNAKASQALNQALQVAKTLKDPESKVMVFKVETDSQGNVISKTEVEDPFDRASFLESIAINYAQAGLNNQARQVAQLIKTPAIRSQLNQRLNCY